MCAADADFSQTSSPVPMCVHSEGRWDGCLDACVVDLCQPLGTVTYILFLFSLGDPSSLFHDSSWSCTFMSTIFMRENWKSNPLIPKWNVTFRVLGNVIGGFIQPITQRLARPPAATLTNLRHTEWQGQTPSIQGAAILAIPVATDLQVLSHHHAAAYPGGPPQALSTVVQDASCLVLHRLQEARWLYLISGISWPSVVSGSETGGLLWYQGGSHKRVCKEAWQRCSCIDYMLW